MKLQIIILTLTFIGTSYCAFSMDINSTSPELKNVAEKTDASQLIAAVVTSTTAPKSTTVAPSSTTVAPSSTTATSSTTPVPTTKPTTAPPTPPPTTKPTTAPPTPPPTTKPTTFAPNVTTTQAPNTTTTVAPPPAPKPGHWFVKENNVTCIVADMIIQLNISYPGIHKTEFAVMNINNDTITKVRGNCGNDSQTLELILADNNTVVLNFTSNSTTKQFAISSIIVTVNASALPNASEKAGVLKYEEDKVQPLFSTPLAMSYKCNKWETVNMTERENNLTATFKVSDTQIQAFHTDADVKFGIAQDCEPLDTPDMVPIAVGVSLAVMILVVLVAYLIGRRRVNPNGYVSM